ncbi:AmpG family muropeptide MFS transporter [Pseudoluteimonas lycopersici]|uniref:AmpG family muropeptide MFS transporter n=1 Tax=Pseudoluteimonas lycopersici TaxID=1324796 RepID=A0A516V5W0_9GAMM|nr:MFS transporter [Lysobacter lycopersici]QDQ73914.1 AmpG family muropeptide MFS transporter [Lysobacter lycopersici]
MNAVFSRWRQSLGVYANPKVRAMLFLGFASGLPFSLVLTTLSARLRQAGIDRTTIGYFSLVGLAYSLKYFWAPVVDRLPLPVLGRLGRRRSWMLLAQLGIVAGLVLMAMADPALDAVRVAWLAVFTAFCSATQDIAVDAYRIEAAETRDQGAMAAAYQIGYQVALITAGAGALTAAAGYGWQASYLIMATCGLVGIATTLFIAEPSESMDRASTLGDEPLVQRFLQHSTDWPTWLRGGAAWFIGAVVCPFADFFQRNGLKVGVPILLLIVCYRLNYTTMGVAANTFYLDMGFTLDQIALVSKLYGVIMTMLGAVLAGVLIRRMGVAKTMLLGLVALSVANLLYAHMAAIKPGIAWLATVVSADNVANGIAGTSFIAYMSSLTSARYTATQYALFGTLWSLPAKSIASQWGKVVDAYGYPAFFVYTALIALPAILLVLWQIRRLRMTAVTGDA